MGVIQLKSPVPRIITGLGRGYEKKLHRPPTEETIRKAAGAFAGDYNKWMVEHHAIATKMLGHYQANGLMGRGVAEVGCGTGVLTNMLIVERGPAIFNEIADGNFGSPFTFICLDFSKAMLDIAKGSIAKTMRQLSRNADVQPKKLSAVDFSIASGDGSEQLLYKDKPVINVRFACKDATQLKEVPDGDNTDTLILSYVIHWFRGLEGKQTTLKELYDVLPPAGRVISLEEYPLVVRCDLHPDEPAIQELADMIEKATTVVPLSRWRELYTVAGFVPLDIAGQHETAIQTRLATQIDDYHRMFGRLYVKAPIMG